MIVFCGDINSDFKRNTGFVQSVCHQVEDMSLDTAWRTHEVDFTFVYNDADDNSHTAILDHLRTINIEQVNIQLLPVTLFKT